MNIILEWFLDFFGFRRSRRRRNGRTWRNPEFPGMTSRRTQEPQRSYQPRTTTEIWKPKIYPPKVLTVSSVEGILDPITGTEFRANENIYQCVACTSLYHSDSRQFLVEQNNGRCASCGQSASLRLVRAVERPVKIAKAPVQYRPYAVTLDEVKQYLGRVVSFEGRVVQVHVSPRGTYFVKFEHGGIPDVFKLVIFPNYVHNFAYGGETIEAYSGKRLRVRGLIQEHEKWGWEILVFTEDGIEVLS